MKKQNLRQKTSPESGASDEQRIFKRLEACFLKGVDTGREQQSHAERRIASGARHDAAAWQDRSIVVCSASSKKKPLLRNMGQTKNQVAELGNFSGTPRFVTLFPLPGFSQRVIGQSFPLFHAGRGEGSHFESAERFLALAVSWPGGNLRSNGGGG